MTDLLRLLTLLAEKRAPRQKPGFFARIGFSAIAGFFLLWALFCALIALWIYVIPFVGPAGAPLGAAVRGGPVRTRVAASGIKPEYLLNIA